MKREKLFSVLVTGGLLLTSPTLMADSEVMQPDDQAIIEELIETKPVPASPAFCSVGDENSCTTDEEGMSVPIAGIYCCWGTTCEE